MRRSFEYSQANDKVTEMSTLTAVLNKAAVAGYTASFAIDGTGLFVEGKDEKHYTPEDIHIENFYRFEGDTDPADMAIAYMIVTSDGTKGMLVDAYGTYSDGRVNEFIKRVEDIHKDVNNNK